MFLQLFTHNSPQDWLFAVLAAVTFLTGLMLLRKVVLHRLTTIAKNTDTSLDDLLVEILLSTKIWLVAGTSLYVAAHFLVLPVAMEKLVDRAFICLLILQSGFWVNRGFAFWLNRRLSDGDTADEGARAMTRSLLLFLVRVALWSLVALLLLDNLGLNVTALVASLGIGGIAVALAVQNILGDLFASLSIAIDQPFVIGDFIIIDDYMGTVEHVGLKTTRISSLGGEQIIFSNNDLLKSRIRNYKRMRERRVVFSVGVTYDTPPAKLEMIPQLIQQAVETQEKARFDRAHFKTFGAYSLDYEIVYYVLEPDYTVYMNIQQAVNLRLLHAFNDNSIEFAFPTQTLHFAGNIQP